VLWLRKCKKKINDPNAGRKCRNSFANSSELLANAGKPPSIFGFEINRGRVLALPSSNTRAAAHGSRWHFRLFSGRCTLAKRWHIWSSETTRSSLQPEHAAVVIFHLVLLISDRILSPNSLPLSFSCPYASDPFVRWEIPAESSLKPRWKCLAGTKMKNEPAGSSIQDLFMIIFTLSSSLLINLLFSC